MRIALLSAIVTVIGLGSVAVAAEKFTGILIDQKCAEKVAKEADVQAAAEKHEKACCLKCGKDAGYALVSGGKVMKLDAAANEKVEKYLNKEKSTTHVTIEGEQKDGMIEVVSIKNAGKGDKNKEHAHEAKPQG